MSSIIGDNYFDSRDIDSRLDDIEMEYDFDPEEFQGPSDFEAHIRKTDEDDADEYAALYSAQQEGIAVFGAGGWHSGITLVLDSHWQQYAEEYAGELGLVDEEQAWPFCHIDWEAAAESLQMDYSEVEFGDDTYWGRA